MVKGLVGQCRSRWSWADVDLLVAGHDGNSVYSSATRGNHWGIWGIYRWEQMGTVGSAQCTEGATGASWTKNRHVNITQADDSISTTTGLK